ncbi:MAG: helix-turn-helix transcriptional regulator [Alkaliphilus sp.]|nr:helix-turn-helix transcriptional regulator [Alkaliphilus sp.]
MIINDILKDPWDIFDDIDEQTRQEFELSDILVNIACKIINYRLDNNMTQRDLANKLDITQAMVSKIESGEYNPSIEFLFKISKKLDWRFGITFEENYSNVSVQYNIDKAQAEEENEEIETLKGLAA